MIQLGFIFFKIKLYLKMKNFFRASASFLLAFVIFITFFYNQKITDQKQIFSHDFLSNFFELLGYFIALVFMQMQNNKYIYILAAFILSCLALLVLSFLFTLREEDFNWVSYFKNVIYFSVPFFGVILFRFMKRIGRSY